MIYAENILLCIGIPFLVSLLFIRGETRRYIAAFLLGMVMCLIAAYISGFFNIHTYRISFKSTGTGLIQNHFAILLFELQKSLAIFA